MTFALVYSIQDDLGGNVDLSELRAAIEPLLTPAIEFVTGSDTEVTISIESEPVQSEQDAAAAAVAAHATGAVARARQVKFDEVDEKTDELIAAGFEFEGRTFSLSLEAQSYWTNMYQARAVFTALGEYPLRVNTKDDDDALDVADEAQVEAMYTVALGTVKAALASGTAVKDLVRAATTVADVEAVVDPR